MNGNQIHSSLIKPEGFGLMAPSLTREKSYKLIPSVYFFREAGFAPGTLAASFRLSARVVFFAGDFLAVVVFAAGFLVDVVAILAPYFRKLWYSIVEKKEFGNVQ